MCYSERPGMEADENGGDRVSIGRKPRKEDKIKLELESASRNGRGLTHGRSEHRSNEHGCNKRRLRSDPRG